MPNSDDEKYSSKLEISRSFIRIFANIYKYTHVRQEQDNNTTKDSKYDGMLKYTGIFGGVQGLASLITLLKVGIVSKLLGPIGVGMVDVYNRSIELVKKNHRLRHLL